MFGISSFCLHKEPLDDALDQLSTVTGLVEIMDDGPHFIKSAELLESYSLQYTLHAPSRSINIASLHESIRKASVKVISDCFLLAGEVNADVVIHPGYFAWVEEQERALRQFRKSLADLTDFADSCSVSFYIENMGNWNYFFLRYPEEIDLLGEFGLALDVGHAHLNHCLDEFLARPFRHIHLHDNDGREDTHDAVGQGTIGFDEVMEAVRRDRATPVIEVATFEGVLQSLEYLSARVGG